MSYTLFDTEREAETAVKLAGYQATSIEGVYVKDGHKVRVQRDSWAAKYFISSVQNNRK